MALNPYYPQTGDRWASPHSSGELTIRVENNWVHATQKSPPDKTTTFSLTVPDFIDRTRFYRKNGYTLQDTTPMTDTTLSGSHNAHARLAPSDSKRWTQCTASIAFETANSHRVPADTSSKESNEGTEAHDWAAKILLKEVTLEEIPENFQTAVGAYVQYCLDTAARLPGGSTVVEAEVPLFYQADANGTCDFGVLSDNEVDIIDLKYGAGVLVKAEENTQLAVYALSLIRFFEDVYEFSPDTKINIHIFQPRHREGKDQLPWSTTLAELEAFGKDIETRSIQAHVAVDRVTAKLPCGTRDFSCNEILEAAPGAKFHPEEGDGGSCRWCKCKAFCDKRLSAGTDQLAARIAKPAELLLAMPDLTKEEKKLPLEDRLQVVAQAVEAEIGIPSGEVVSDEFLVALYSNASAIRKFLDDAEEYLTERAHAGKAPEGVKLVWGREGNRLWVNEEEADTFLAGQKISTDERYTKKLISPTQAEKLLDGKLKPRGQSRFEELIHRSAAKKVLALASDKREAVEPNQAMFRNLDEEDFEV